MAQITHTTTDDNNVLIEIDPAKVVDAAGNVVPIVGIPKYRSDNPATWSIPTTNPVDGSPNPSVDGLKCFVLDVAPGSANITISDDSGASDNVVLTDTLGVATTFGVGITDVSKVQPVRAARSRSASTS